MVWYIVMYCVGIAAAIFSPVPNLERVLNVIGPISITALVASLLVPFAGFSAKENVQKWAVQYGIVPLFGAYTVLVWAEGSYVGMVMLAGSSAVHLGYWMSSLHSRQYRMDLFHKAFAISMPGTMQLVARLNATRRSHEADRIVAEILGSSRVYADQIENALRESREHGAEDNGCVTTVLQELATRRRLPYDKSAQSGEATTTG
ncbi:MAG: hypothetical protein Q8P56_03675 [Candidatus Uhrbacteria bacterium]|nr:hypothetical protein [Candidatus Uhrbacteria bacterium]